MKSSTETLIQALQILSVQVQSKDGIANAAIAEAAKRMEEMDKRIKRLEDAGGEAVYMTNIFSRAARWNKAIEAKP
jgi:muramoyltetrapeptide carboxypeptidase LdcA involved in peptidoglycan recycling